MQTNINADQLQCKPIINANPYQCKPTSMQINHQCKPTSMRTNINANQPSVQTNHESTKLQDMTRMSSNACIYMLLRAPGGGSLSSIPADLPCRKKEIIAKPMKHQHVHKSIEKTYVFITLFEFRKVKKLIVCIF